MFTYIFTHKEISQNKIYLRFEKKILVKETEKMCKLNNRTH